MGQREAPLVDLDLPSLAPSKTRAIPASDVIQSRSHRTGHPRMCGRARMALAPDEVLQRAGVPPECWARPRRPAAGPPEGGQEPARKTALAPAAVGAAAIKVEPAAVREEGGQGDGALAAAGVKWEAGQGLEVTKCEVKEEGLLNRELQLEEAG